MLVRTRKHTPIVSEQQRRLFGLWVSHPERRPASITAKEVRSHLSESKGKELPASTTARRRRRNRE